MKILFTHSYFLRFDPKQWKLQQPYPPLGTIQAAAVLRNTGFEVQLFDTMFCNDASDINEAIESFKPDALVIYDDGFNYLTKMCLTNMREAAFQMIRNNRNKIRHIVVCSSDSTDNYKEYIQQGTDYIILGEGEETLKELFTSLQKNIPTKEIKGLVFKDPEKTIIKNAGRPVIKLLDEMPLPAWDLVNIGEYRRRWLNSSGYFSLNISSTRGCPYKCNWCAKPIYGNRYNSRSPGHVTSEIKHLLQEYQPDHLWFCDDIFGLKPGWVESFSTQLKQQGLKIRYKIQSRADLLSSEKTVKALAESGCETAWIGSESGSQKVLDAMDKGITISQIHEARNNLKKYKIKSGFFLQFGYPGEGKKEINETLSMLKKLLPEDIGISVSYPLPGTVFYENVKSQIGKKANWTDSDELAMMFHANYSSSFYKTLHRFVHKKYRMWQGLENLKNISKSLNTSSLKSIFLLPYYIPSSFYSGLKLKLQKQ